MSDVAFRTIKIRAESYDKIQEILFQVAKSGWKSVGSKRQSAATIADVVDESLIALKARRRSSQSIADKELVSLMALSEDVTNDVLNAVNPKNVRELEGVRAARLAVEHRLKKKSRRGDD